jgi:hypothetical protein
MEMDTKITRKGSFKTLRGVVISGMFIDHTSGQWLEGRYGQINLDERGYFANIPILPLTIGIQG